MLEFEPEVEIQVLDRRLEDWGLPKYQTESSAGIDMFACIESAVDLHPGAPPLLVGSGIALLMKSRFMAAILAARSGLGHKKGLVLSQAIGTIDADYTAEIFMSVWLRPGSEIFTLRPGDRIAQLVFVPILRPDFRLVDAFSEQTGRGAGGFGSTGR